MTTLDLILIAFSLSLDAFSVSISCGMKLATDYYRKFFKISLAFGVFQAIMPLLGYLFSYTFLKELVSNYAGLLSFAVFLLLALKTFYDYFTAKGAKEIAECKCTGHKCLTTLAIATSIDAFLVGGVLGVQVDSLVFPVVLIGVITFVVSMLGCIVGNRSISWLQNKSRLVAGLILLTLAIKSLL